MSEVAGGSGWGQAPDQEVGIRQIPRLLCLGKLRGQFSRYATSPPPAREHRVHISATVFWGCCRSSTGVTCGNGLVTTAAICPRCGTPASGTRPGQIGTKSRTTAVVLAVFLSFWSFLYTYSNSAWKFWLGLGLNILTFLIDIAGHYGSGVSLVWLFAILGVWIWSIVDRCITPLDGR